MRRVVLLVTLVASAVVWPACSFDRSPKAGEAVFGAREGDGGVRDGGGPIRSQDGSAGADGTTSVRDAGDAGGSSAGGSGGSTPPPACAACPDKTPICLSPSNVCVACARDRHCGDAEQPICDLETNSCVRCTEHAHCDGDTPRCDPASHACVGCLAAEDCGGDTLACDPEAQQCVECLEHADCTDPKRPQCDDQACVPCSSSDACAGREHTLVCHEADGSAVAGKCVQCTAADETACGDRVCDERSHACTDRRRASKSTCQECIADSECVADHRCIDMQFDSEPLGHGFCLKLLSSGCQRPYAASPIHRESRSGAAQAEYCGIDEQQTTCAAIAGLLADAECPGGSDAECATGGGVCRTVNGVANRCTYACEASAQCPSAFQCPSDYCGSSSSSGGED